MNSYHCLLFTANLRSLSSLLFRFFIILTACLLTMPGSARTADIPATAQNYAQQIIIPPFEVQTGTPYPHLQTGLANILATRVTKRTGHIVAPHSTETDRLTDLLRQQDNAAVQKIIQGMGDNTYLFSGTLKEKEKGYEITIAVFGSRPTAQIALSQKFNQLDRALSALDELSLDIAEKIFSLPRPKNAEVVATSDGLEGFHTAHPERIFKEKKYSDEEYSEKVTEPEVKSTDFGIQSSRKDILPSSTALAMTVGDLDNDGKEEFVLLERTKLALYHRAPNSSFERIAFQPIARHLGLHTVYLADLDKNGLQEIYIGASNGTNPASQILEWDGRVFRVLYQNAPYYLRPGVDTEGRPCLLGQENVFQETGGNAFYSLRREADGSLRKTKRLNVPPGFNIYDFIKVDLNLDGVLEFVGITRGNKLTVIDSSGKTLWKSEKNYGASKNILGTLSSTIDGDRNQANNPEPIYMHSRIIAQDLDGDRIPEIILGRNRLADITFLKRLRSFEGSSITALSWDDGKMKTIWESPRLSGYTADFQMLKDTDTLDRFQIFSIEQEHTNNLMPFWSARESLVHSYLIDGKSPRTP